MKNEFLRRSWVEIDLNIIKNNVYMYMSNISTNVEIMAVVKADAYGHGDVEVATCLQDSGIKHFAVSNVIEAIRLREAGIIGQILVLGYTPIEKADLLLRYDITQTILDEEYLRKIISKNLFIKCQMAIDTGMNRIGLDADNPIGCERLIRKCHEFLNLTGIFTHLCVADNEDTASKEFTNLQITKFKKVQDLVKDLSLQYIHYANSAGGLWHQNDGDIVRLGIALYGLKPSYSNKLPEGISAALEWKSVVSMIKTVHSGETIGYGKSYYVKREMKVATIPTGYADGYNRLLSNKGFVLIHGRKAPIVGRICMDQFMVDVTDIQNINIDDEVILLGKSGDENFTADDMAEMIETIGYEIVCTISKRVPRVYVKCKYQSQIKGDKLDINE